MKALVVTAPGQLEYKEIEKPVPGPYEVLTRVCYCGICGTDAEIYHGDTSLTRDGLVQYPVRIGHEWSGIVEAVGQNSIYGFSEQTNNQITISGQRFECSVENPMDYIGRKVRFFAKEDETSIYENVFTMEIMPVNTVTSFDIEDVTEPENDRIYYEGEEKEQYVKISDEANILYNGRGIAYDKQMIAPVDNNINAPMEGDITCIDNDGDNKVDVVIVNSYWSFYADSVIAKQGMIADYYYTKVNPDIRFYQFLKPGEDENQKIYKNTLFSICLFDLLYNYFHYIHHHQHKLMVNSPHHFESIIFYHI